MESLADVGLSTVQRFKLLEEVKQLSVPKQVQEWPTNLFRVQFDRFELWAVNLGLFVMGHGSLDYRIRDSESMRESIYMMIKNLNRSLDEVLDYVNGDADHGDEDSDTDSEVESDIDLLLEGIKDPIDRLYKLAVWIRNPATRLASSKARNFKQIDEQTNIDLFESYKNFDYDYVSSLFLEYEKHKALQENAIAEYKNKGKASASVDEEVDSSEHVWEPIRGVLELNKRKISHGTESYLVRRISRANGRRRQQFAYWKRHKDKLREHASSYVEAPTRQLTDEEHVNNGHIGEANTPLSITTATQLRLTHAEGQEILEKDGMLKLDVSEYAPSAWNPSKDTVSFPPPPKVSTSDNYFECPFCFTICPISLLSEKAWRAHIIRDLRPYVCTYDQCLSAEQLYDTRDDWIQHEISTHQKIFRCFEHEEEIFTTLGAYEEHVRAYHDDNAVSAKFATSTIQNVHRSCPVCSVVLGSIQKLQSHIALHLERFAMFSLPRHTDISEESETGSKVFTTHSENEKSFDVDLDSESIVADKAGDDQFDTITDIKQKESLLLSIPEDDYDLLSGHQSPPRLIYQFSDDDKEYGDDNNDLFARYADSDPPSSPERVYSPAVSSALRSDDSLDQLESKVREDEETMDKNTSTGYRLPSPVNNGSQVHSEPVTVDEEKNEKEEKTQRLEEDALRQRLAARMNGPDTAIRRRRHVMLYEDDGYRFSKAPEPDQDDTHPQRESPIVINPDGLSTAEEAPNPSLDAFGLTDSDRESTTTTSAEGSQTVLEDSEDIGQPSFPMARKKSGELAQPNLRGHTRPSNMPGTSQVAEAVSSDSHPEHVHHFPQADPLLTTGAGPIPVEDSESDTGTKSGNAGSSAQRSPDNMILYDGTETQEEDTPRMWSGGESKTFGEWFRTLKSDFEQEQIMDEEGQVSLEARDWIRQIDNRILELNMVRNRYEKGEAPNLKAQELSTHIKSRDTIMSAQEALRNIQANRKEREAVRAEMKQFKSTKAKDTASEEMADKTKEPEETIRPVSKLVDELQRKAIALTETNGKANELAGNNASEQAPIKFKDAVGRKFSFPFHLCTTWQSMEDLIKQAFLHVDILGPHIQEGHYDLIGPDGEIILPAVWDKVIEPGWSITMTMWPFDKIPLVGGSQSSPPTYPGVAPGGPPGMYPNPQTTKSAPSKRNSVSRKSLKYTLMHSFMSAGAPKKKRSATLKRRDDPSSLKIPETMNDSQQNTHEESVGEATAEKSHQRDEEEHEAAADESERAAQVQLQELAQANANFWHSMPSMSEEKAEEKRTDSEAKEEEAAREDVAHLREETAEQKPLLSQRIRDMIPNYIAVYWNKVDSQYPIIHRPSFENPTDIPEDQLEVLKCAMAAVATQFFENKAHHINGRQLYLYAEEKARRYASSGAPGRAIVQATLLNEYYVTLRRQRDEKLREESSNLEAGGKENEEKESAREDVIRPREDGSRYGHSGYS